MADEGFLSRWSRRKEQVRKGQDVAPEPLTGESVAPASASEPPPQETQEPAALAQAQPFASAEPGAQLPPKRPPGPTLEDVRTLTFESDFRRFVAPDVSPDVKNAAVKKLFADARFNVRDAMDVYADDYSLPDPLPESMMRKMASAQFLKLFDEEPKEEAGQREVADDVGPQNVAQSPQAPQAVPEPPNAHADLRLQQDDAPPGEGPGAGAGRGAGAPHDAVPPGGGELPEGDPR